MKVGDLVRWKLDGDVGIVLNIEKPCADVPGDAYIYWFKETAYGTFRINHDHLELVQ